MFLTELYNIMHSADICHLPIQLIAFVFEYITLNMSRYMQLMTKYVKCFPTISIYGFIIKQTSITQLAHSVPISVLPHLSIHWIQNLEF